MVTQYDESDNQSGGDLHFGPDGYLSVSLSDEGEEVGTVWEFTKNRRHPTPRCASASGPVPPTMPVPADNPFAGATNVNGIAVDPAQVRAKF